MGKWEKYIDIYKQYRYLSRVSGGENIGIFHKVLVIIEKYYQNITKYLSEIRKIQDTCRNYRKFYLINLFLQSIKPVWYRRQKNSLSLSVLKISNLKQKLILEKNVDFINISRLEISSKYVDCFIENSILPIHTEDLD